jgi:hypothetical protein
VCHRANERPLNRHLLRRPPSSHVRPPNPRPHTSDQWCCSPRDVCCPSLDVRRRQPLPPQSARFREMLDQVPAASVPPAAPLRHRELSAQQPANTSSLPSGPRIARNFQPPPQQVAVRDASHPDFARSSRPPPSGPSAVSTSVARSRATNETLLPDEGQHHRDRDADVDVLPPSRSQHSYTHYASTNNSGMYADREIASDGLPTRPRSSRPRSHSQSMQAGTPLAPSPTTPSGYHALPRYTDNRLRDAPPLSQSVNASLDNGLSTHQRHQHPGVSAHVDGKVSRFSNSLRDRQQGEPQATRQRIGYSAEGQAEASVMISRQIACH